MGDVLLVSGMVRWETGCCACETRHLPLPCLTKRIDGGVGAGVGNDFE